ncbi:DUF4920 domain-containing protein [Tenacibaculum maritimum]|uniref:Lipoprotein n=1 Tax=Tenacibaculum maritimum NCIMB 2154 TaxID=1349785 RepID=A0A2H1E802_9FLAO|nr:DUF4920 domain-containing protein [Tenacibaculum maritimum]MCD9563621.1 DUF4920 domain-containing protein [Tenacibaculum maritimum]MCD9567044.1 DUF4920 domain-containing protein [Tenacibaculum maritimum]MCD9580054.1 DUF4920 domain-containing protein [Tenacibaculum maritimum]MCD9585910.1 DUF4920 domain-containing protein [Tenacibaculum maritimum]MCD9597626.1 DUF4920 domain-containing protein [Tenacibaculum maritimum]
MRNLLKVGFLMALFFISCKQVAKENQPQKADVSPVIPLSLGAKITKEKALSSTEAFGKIKALQVGDTLHVKLASTVSEVCSKKGCWMKLPLAEGVKMMVRFKDYGFFMPLDSKGKNVIVEGMAFVQETSIAALRHYAEDAGKTKEEIANITSPKKEFAFEANGVLLN